MSKPEEQVVGPSATPKPTPLFLIGVAWLVVAIPLAWGVYQSVVKSLPLFRITSTSR